MPTKLKGLKITSTDLVDQGANPDAHIRLFKRKSDNDDETDGEKQTFFQKFAAALGNAYKECAPNTVAKDAQTFAENIFEEQMRDVTHEMYGYCEALMDSLRSIIVDNEKAGDAKADMMGVSLEQFSTSLKTAIPKWAHGQKAAAVNVVTKDGPESNTTDQNGVNTTTADTIGKSAKEDTNNMKFDKSKMTPEEISTLENLEKRYGIADDTAPAEPPAPTGDVNKSAEAAPAPVTETTPAPAPDIHPEVKKALEDFETVKKSQLAEIEELKKSLEMERLTTFAKKYEVIGKKADELAAKLYDLKKAGGTVYADYVALLDENLTAVEKGGLFAAIGSDNSGSSDTIGKINAAAGEIAKAANSGLTPEAVIKAWETNPELAAAYEAEYKNGGV